VVNIPSRLKAELQAGAVCGCAQSSGWSCFCRAAACGFLFHWTIPREIFSLWAHYFRHQGQETRFRYLKKRENKQRLPL
jgi:hypothetical protein